MKKNEIENSLNSLNTDIDDIINEFEEGVYGKPYLVENKLRISYNFDTHAWEISSEREDSTELVGVVKLNSNNVFIKDCLGNTSSTYDYEDILDIAVEVEPGTVNSKYLILVIELIGGDSIQFS